jgi:hypothetical protein
MLIDVVVAYHGNILAEPERRRPPKAVSDEQFDIAASKVLYARKFTGTARSSAADERQCATERTSSNT